MRVIVSAFVVLTVAGCMQPSILSANRDEVVIAHDPALTSSSDMQGQADTACARFGKRAVFVQHDRQAPLLGARYARFECR